MIASVRRQRDGFTRWGREGEKQRGCFSHPAHHHHEYYTKTNHSVSPLISYAPVVGLNRAIHRNGNILFLSFISGICYSIVPHFRS
jgi:hypothetical protein